MKADQLAFYAPNENAEFDIKKLFNLTEAKWITDDVTSHNVYWPGAHSEYRRFTKARLSFNYDIGIELEILRFIDGYHWAPFFNDIKISHLGIHLDDDEPFPETEWPCVLETFTVSHTSEYLTKEGSPGFGRKYHYRIYKLGDGAYVKYIKRIHP